MKLWSSEILPVLPSIAGNKKRHQVEKIDQLEKQKMEKENECEAKMREVDELMEQCRKQKTKVAKLNELLQEKYDKLCTRQKIWDERTAKCDQALVSLDAEFKRKEEEWDTMQKVTTMFTSVCLEKKSLYMKTILDKKKMKNVPISRNVFVQENFRNLKIFEFSKFSNSQNFRILKKNFFERKCGFVCVKKYWEVSKIWKDGKILCKIRTQIY